MWEYRYKTSSLQALFQPVKRSDGERQLNKYRFHCRYKKEKNTLFYHFAFCFSLKKLATNIRYKIQKQHFVPHPTYLPCRLFNPAV
jgi:hypothetical protein